MPLLALLACTLTLCLRSLLYRDNDCNHAEASKINNMPPVNHSNQRLIGGNNHYSRLMVVLVPSRNFVPNFSVVFTNWCQIFSAPHFVIPNFARMKISLPR